ncbi:Protein of unknown function [Bacillus thuringiensis]
MMIAN